MVLVISPTKEDVARQCRKGIGFFNSQLRTSQVKEVTESQEYYVAGLEIGSIIGVGFGSDYTFLPAVRSA